MMALPSLTRMFIIEHFNRCVTGSRKDRDIPHRFLLK
jgi:hypothetical protein